MSTGTKLTNVSLLKSLHIWPLSVVDKNTFIINIIASTESLMAIVHDHHIILCYWTQHAEGLNVSWLLTVQLKSHCLNRQIWFMKHSSADWLGDQCTLHLWALPWRWLARGSKSAINQEPPGRYVFFLIIFSLPQFLQRLCTLLNLVPELDTFWFRRDYL